MRGSQAANYYVPVPDDAETNDGNFFASDARAGPPGRCLTLKRPGYSLHVSDRGEPCAIPPCAHPAVVTLRMDVDGSESELVTCHLHADWLRGYVQEDAAVHLVGEVSGDTRDDRHTG